MSSVFSVFNESKPGGGYRYLEPDQKYTLKVNSVQHLDTRKGEAFAVEFEIVKSTSDTLKAGMTASWFQKMGGSVPVETAAGAIKGFLAAVLNADAEDVKEEDLRDAINDDQPLTGMVVDCETVSGVLKDKTSPFTYHNWRPCVENGVENE